MNKPTEIQVKEAAVKTGKVVTNPMFLKVAGIAVGAYLLYKVFTGVSAKVTPDPVNNVDIVVTPDISKTTITTEQAKIYAQTLLEAMDIQPYGTDPDIILAVFQKINADDFKLIFNAFGMKNYNGTGSPPESWIFQQLDNYQERNLVFWLRSELNSWLDATTYNLVKKIVEEADFIF